MCEKNGNAAGSSEGSGEEAEREMKEEEEKYSQCNVSNERGEEGVIPNGMSLSLLPII